MRSGSQRAIAISERIDYVLPQHSRLVAMIRIIHAALTRERIGHLCGRSVGFQVLLTFTSKTALLSTDVPISIAYINQSDLQTEAIQFNYDYYCCWDCRNSEHIAV